MTALESLKAYCVKNGWETTPRSLYETLNE